MQKHINRYELVHKVADLAKQKETENRNPIEDKKNNLFKEVNKPKKKRNYVEEAFNEIVSEMGGL